MAEKGSLGAGIALTQPLRSKERNERSIRVNSGLQPCRLLLQHQLHRLAVGLSTPTLGPTPLSRHFRSLRPKPLRRGKRRALELPLFCATLPLCPICATGSLRVYLALPTAPLTGSPCVASCGTRAVCPAFLGQEEGRGPALVALYEQGQRSVIRGHTALPHLLQGSRRGREMPQAHVQALGADSTGAPPICETTRQDHCHAVKLHDKQYHTIGAQAMLALGHRILGAQQYPSTDVLHQNLNSLY